MMFEKDGEKKIINNHKYCIKGPPLEILEMLSRFIYSIDLCDCRKIYLHFLQNLEKFFIYLVY